MVRLKAGALVKPNSTAPRFTGAITCYTDPATGLVTGLQLGGAAAICSTDGTARTVTVPADGAVVGVVASVDAKSGLLGKLTLAVESPSAGTTSVVQCGGTAGGVPVSALPKLAALSSLTAGCAPLPAVAGRRRALAASGVAVDAATLTVTAAPLTAAAGGGVTLLTSLVSTAAQMTFGYYNFSPGNDGGSTFTTGSSPVTINTVVVPLAYLSAATSCTLSIQTVSGSPPLPTGTIVGTAVTAAVPTQSPVATLVSFTGLGAAVAANTQYAFSVSCPSSAAWMVDPAVLPTTFTGSFTAGNFVIYQNGAWSGSNPVSLIGAQFKITS